MIGTKLAHYEITSHLGSGGMGDVYQATDTKLGRSVAIKLLPEAFTHDAERAARFDREARVLASLNHPNIAAIHGIEESGGRKFLVMELVPGETLAEKIKRCPIPLEEALGIATQITEALEAAHEKGVVHRDLKPANIKMTADGKVKVLDFGLAKAFAGETVNASSSNSPTMSLMATQQGIILGTAAYMSPEQAKGREVDRRTDIFAFGAVLYEMLTGHQAFGGEDVADILGAVLKSEPDWTLLPANIPPSIQKLLRLCLQKDAKKRRQAAGDVRIDIEQAQEGSGDAAIPTAVPVEHSRLGWIVAAAAMVGVAALAFVHFRETPPVVPTVRYQLTASNGGEFRSLQLSPDGRYLAYVYRNAKDTRLHVRALDSLEEREIPGTDGTTYPFFSPDSRHIAFFSQGKLKQMAVAGGPATNIADAPDSRGGAWGPDGTIVFAPTVNGGLSRVSVSSGGPAAPLNLPNLGEGGGARYPVFLPDSDRFFYLAATQKPESNGIYVSSLSGAPPVRLLPDFSIARFVPSSGSKTSGHLFFRRDTTLMAQPFDAANLKVIGEAFPLADQIPDVGNAGYAAFAVAANGTLIFSSSGGPAEQEREIVWLDRAGKRANSLLKQKGISSFALSPNRAQVVYSLGIPGSSTPGDLWLHDTTHGTTQRFTFGPFSALFPHWSPDNGAIAFTRATNNLYELYTKVTQTSAKEEALGVRGFNTTISSTSADGKLMVYSTTGDTTKDDLWLLPLDGDRKPKLFKQTPFQESGGRISPDGLWMAYSSDASGQDEIYIEPLAGGGSQRQISAGGGEGAIWRSDGREFYFISPVRGVSSRLMAVDVKPGPDLTFGTPHELFIEPNLLVNRRAFSFYPNANGSQFLALLSVGDAPGAPALTVVTNWHAAYGK
jgi:serine/threonine protein kinase/Tol biopolymer transport system component